MDNIYLIDALNVTGGLLAIVLYAVDVLEKEPAIDPKELVEKFKLWYQNRDWLLFQAV